MQTHPGRIDWAWSGVDEDVVQEAAESASDKGRNNRYPEVMVTSSPYLWAIANNIRHESWTEVSSEIHGIARLESEASSQTKY